LLSSIGEDLISIATHKKIKPMKYIFSIAILCITQLLVAQSNKPVTENFTVGGTCNMCKERIERALDVKGVKFVEYTLSTHNLEVTYVPSKISHTSLHDLLNNAGHDTELSACSDEQYEAIHHCCKYRTHEHGSDHENHTEDSEENHDHEHDH